MFPGGCASLTNWELCRLLLMKPELTQARLKELLHYDPETGHFTWRVSRSRTRAGSRAGTVVTHGYIQIGIDGLPRLAHRLAFLYMTGETPPEVDHINREKSDNRWKNLRPATRRENQGNVGLLRSNTSGHRGVSWNKKSGKWHAQGRCGGGRKIHLGLFDDLGDAAAAAQSWRVDSYGEYAAGLTTEQDQD